MTLISKCKTIGGYIIDRYDVTVTLADVSYPASVQQADEGDGWIVTLYRGAREYEAVIPADTCPALAIELGGEMVGHEREPAYELAALQALTDEAAYREAIRPIAAAARRLELEAAPAKVRRAASADMQANALRKAAQAARDERKARHAERDQRKSERLIAAGAPATDCIAGSGWQIVFDATIARTRVLFDAYPGKEAIARLKAHGYSWNAVAREWRRGYSAKARIDALELAAELPR